MLVLISLQTSFGYKKANSMPNNVIAIRIAFIQLSFIGIEINRLTSKKKNIEENPLGYVIK